MVNNTKYNYPPGFAYVLWLINKIYALFKNPYNINEYWADNNLFYLFLLKLITIAADLLIVWLIIKIAHVILNGVKRSEGSSERSERTNVPIKSGLDSSPSAQNDKGWVSNLGKIFALFYFLNPAVIYDGVVWGQVDQLGLALFLASVYLLFIGKPKLGSIVFTVSCLLKFQNIIFIPLFYLFIFKRFSFKELMSSLAVTFLTFTIVVLPFFWGKQMEKLIWLLTINSDWFPWYSLNAFNGWWIAAGLKGMQLVDKHLVLGIISAKQLGLYLFIFAYFISTVTVLLAKKENLFRNFILACSLAVFAFFHLLTQSHERYLFPVMGLLPLLVILGRTPSIRGTTPESNNDSGRALPPKAGLLAKMTSIKLFSTFYLLLTTFFFLNMYLSLGWNYPDQVFPAFTREQTLGMSLWISIFQIILFAIFFIWYLRIELMRQIGLIRLIGVIGLLLIISLWLKNADYFLGKPISLTALKPVGYRQDYLQPVNNKTVESGRGVKFWNRLSVNYYFYDQGIGSHADSEITYHLGRKFSKFSTDFGIDTEADQSAKVFFSLVGDGRELFKSELKGRFDQPGTATVDVRRVNYLTLKITKATESNFGAHADWLNPRLTR